jgi:AraC-like DNA-binding protein
MLKPVKPYSRYVMDAIKAIKQHIDENPLQFKTAAALLDHLQTPHRNTIEKAFKDVNGSGIKEYLVKQRLQVARKYLEDGLPKYLVATKCLYKSASSFSSAFRKQFGMSPTEWDKATREDITVIDTAKR